MRCASALAEHHEAAPGVPDQPFCGAVISTSTPVRLHVDPERARRDAVEHEQAADGVHGRGDARR